MRPAQMKIVIVLISLISVTLMTGCTNWKKKYQALDVKHQNTLGLLERERLEKRHLTGKVSEGQQTIQELQKKIAEQNQSPAEASGFGQGYDVDFDPQAGTITVTVRDDILFSPGKATLKKASITELNHILSVLQSKYSGREIDIIGHTDSDPIKKSGWKDNWELSAQRSLSVVRYLLSRGFPADKIRQAGCSEYRPIASNASSSSKARNRRVEIVVYVR